MGSTREVRGSGDLDRLFVGGGGVAEVARDVRYDDAGDDGDAGEE
jgi:hypothetical protein